MDEHVNVSPWVDRVMVRWVGRWWFRIDGQVACVTCHAAQRASDSLAPFEHHPSCNRSGDFAQHPWRELANTLRDRPKEL